jgi:hypothetical protein
MGTENEWARKLGLECQFWRKGSLSERVWWQHDQVVEYEDRRMLKDLEWARRLGLECQFWREGSGSSKLDPGRWLSFIASQKQRRQKSGDKVGVVAQIDYIEDGLYLLWV